MSSDREEMAERIRQHISNPSVTIVEKPGPHVFANPERILRPSVQPGVLFDDEPASFHARLRRPRDWYGIRRLAARWAGALAMVVGAAAIMYAEGQRQPAPGVGFGIALGLLMGAAFLLAPRDGD